MIRSPGQFWRMWRAQFRWAESLADHWRDWGHEHFQRANQLRDALWALEPTNLPCDVDLLRQIADQIDCEGSDCPVSMDWETGVRECARSDDGRCHADNAHQLRELATALEVWAQVRGAQP